MSKTTSVVQIAANRHNATRSTGPKTPKGKQVVASNAIKHGLFSSRLILADEDPAEYQVLLDGLQATLHPAGALEQALVERIAITLWRQRRLTRSETAAIELDHSGCKIAEAVTIELGMSPYAETAIKESDLTDFDQEQADWCRSVLAEYAALNLTTLTDWQQLKKDAPLIYQQLASEAEESQQPLLAYLAEWNDPRDYVTGLVLYCRNQVKAAEQRPMIMALAELVRNKRAIPRAALRDALAKYQVMLDNELYKALKAFREAQEWRLNTLEATTVDSTIAEENGFVS